MIKAVDIKEFEWIKQGIKSIVSIEDENWSGNTLENLLPNNFDRYIKILHPMYENKPVGDKNIFCDASYDGERVVGKRILWRKLAAEYDIQFRPEINSYVFFESNGRRWPQNVLGPEEGTLENDQIREIISILSPLNYQKYFYYYELMKISDLSQDKLFEGKLEDIYELMRSDEIRDFYEENEKFSPSYWWNESKTVCICSDYDLQFTIVGCNNELFASFMKSDILECIEVRYNTRVDYKAMK